MEALSMLKYWRGSGGGGGGGGGGYGDGVVEVKAAAVEVVEEDEEEGNEDEGPFFDLEFAVPEGEEVVVEDETDGEEKEDEVFGFAVSSTGGGSSNGDVSVSLSPSEDLFFNGRLVPLEQDGFPDAVEAGNSKPAGAGQFPAVSLLKSATKFRVFLLGLKKARHATPTTTVGKASEQPTSSPAVAKTPPMGTPGQQAKLFTVKFKVEEVPIISLFTRDNSSKGSSKSSKAGGAAGAGGKPSSADVDGASDAKRLVNKYLKMIKPLYVRVSRRHAEKLKLEPTAEQQSPPLSSSTASSPAVSTSIAGTIKSSSNVSLPAGLRVVCKHLGKSRSASSAAVRPAVTDGQTSSQRRDDSLMQQQDSIQSAILHCKRSFNASTDGAANQAVPAARCGGGDRH